MKNNLMLYVSMFLIFLGVDAIWLTFIARSFYNKYLGYLMSDTPNLLVALIFYLLFIFAMQVLIVQPGVSDPWQRTMFKAIVFGLATYGTYDLTNLATIKDWPLLVTVVDLAWGMTISMIIGLAGHWIAKKLTLL